MKRSYNVFVDNGLYLLAYYLDKSIDEIAYSDIENSIDVMTKEIENFVSCDKYSNLKSMCFSNSTLTQTKSKITLSEKLRGFLEYSGTEYCSICGEYKARVKINNEDYNIGRSYMPNLVANTFYNFSYNLQGINVCPYCLVLTMYSILNCRVNQYAYLYNSTSNDFMEDYTYEMQQENLIDIEIQASKENHKGSKIKLLEELISKNRIYDGHIEQYMFNNSGQSQHIEINNIKNKDIKLLIKLKNKSLLQEFKERNLVDNILNNTLSTNYIYKVYNIEKKEKLASDELIDFLNKEVNILKQSQIDIVKSTTEKLTKSNLDINKVYKDLKLIRTFSAFDDFLIDLNEKYLDSTEEKLFNSEEYLTISDIRSFKQIKNLILIRLV